jgi:hypothetical protein
MRLTCFQIIFLKYFSSKKKINVFRWFWCAKVKKNKKNIFIVYFQLKSTFIKIFYIALPIMQNL